MKSIEVRFNKIKELNPYLSDWVCFALTITNKKVNERTIRQWFKKLVPKDDWPDGDLKQAVGFLSYLSNPLRTTSHVEKSPQNRDS